MTQSTPLTFLESYFGISKQFVTDVFKNKENHGKLQLLRNPIFISYKVEINRDQKFIYLFINTNSKYDMRATKLRYPAIETLVEKINMQVKNKRVNEIKALQAISELSVYEWEEHPLHLHIEKSYAFLCVKLN